MKIEGRFIPERYVGDGLRLTRDILVRDGAIKRRCTLCHLSDLECVGHVERAVKSEVVEASEEVL